MNTTVNLNKPLAILFLGLAAVAVHAGDSGRTFITPPGADPKTAAPFSIGVMVDGPSTWAATSESTPPPGKYRPRLRPKPAWFWSRSSRLWSEAACRCRIWSRSLFIARTWILRQIQRRLPQLLQGQLSGARLCGSRQAGARAHFEIAGVAVKPKRR